MSAKVFSFNLGDLGVFGAMYFRVPETLLKQQRFKRIVAHRHREPNAAFGRNQTNLTTDFTDNCDGFNFFDLIRGHP
jgi:hypothetical protein